MFYAVGSLNNSGISMTKGIISNAKINVKYDDITREVIQCDLVIEDGNSGGALPVLDPAHQNGYFAHYHVFGRPKPLSHAFYGMPNK